ncbi:hypothetical protein ACIRVF_42220 [Kitasatospora sp. NPDC101157]|uniref:hypothetical protein n=1 Tax=Kitasatospora sp. NPDC101157 TaxID=3364098 RepID=UPI00381D67BE
MGRQKANKPRRVRAERPRREPLLALHEQRPTGTFYRLWAATDASALDDWRAWDPKYRGHQVTDAQLLADVKFYASVYGPEAPVHAVLQVERYLAEDAVPWKEPGKEKTTVAARMYGSSEEDRFSIHGLLAGLWAVMDDHAVLCSCVDDGFVDQAIAAGLVWQDPSGRWDAVPAPRRTPTS